MINQVDKNMLMLIDILKELKIIKFDADFCRSVGLRKQNLQNIKNGKNHFTIEHIRLACVEYEANANWIIGISDKIFLGDHIIPKKYHKPTTNSYTKKVESN